MAEHVLTMDKAGQRLFRMEITAEYVHQWHTFMKPEELDMHLMRLLEDIRNTRQLTENWREMAAINGVDVP